MDGNRKNIKYEKAGTSEELPTIVIEQPSMERLPFADEEETNIDTSELEDDDDEDENSDKVGADIEKIRRESLGRRNSISLPNLDDLSVLKRTVQIASDFSNSENDPSDDEEFTSIRSPSRTRRKSVTSPRMLKPPGEEEFYNNSPANSITSVNSLASLLREKIQNLPQTFRKKKSTEYKTKIFVSLLFCACIILIVVAYCLYQQKILAKAYFERIKFNKVKRVMKVYNSDGIEIVTSRIGTTINYDKVLPCLPQDVLKDGSICMEWMHRARLYLHYYTLEQDVKCYNLRWISMSDHIYPTDCFDMSPESGHWYGGGQTMEPAWPLEKGGHTFHPFVTGRIERNEWGNVLKRYFINSKGAVVIVDDESPLYVSIKDTPKKELCIAAKYDDFAFVNRISPTPHLNYSVCVGGNMSELHAKLSEHTLWDGLKKDDASIIDSLLTEPLWDITSDDKEKLTEETISNFTKDFNVIGTLKHGHVLINEFWQDQIGDFTLDEARFPTLDDTIQLLHRRGFRVVLTIQPFISTESFNFAEAVSKRLLISERFSDRSIPALTRYRSVPSAGMLDITNNRTVPWLLEKLKNLKEKYKINAFYFDLGTAYNMPHYYQCEKSLLNPDQYKTLFTSSLQGDIPVFAVSSAIERPKSPAFVVLPKFESSWEGLRRVIPTILTYGIIGYPFLIPGAIGGDYESAEAIMMANETDKLLPDQELYLRWMQLATFLPVIRYNHLPTSYSDKIVLEAAKNASIFRQSKVAPVLKKYARVALNLGLPIVRPLWMLDSNDPACHIVADEFSIGEDIIVAPILYPGAKQREVYLPAGVWKDGIDGSLRKGSRWIHDYKVDEDKVAYFEKMPENSRF